MEPVADTMNPPQRTIFEQLHPETAACNGDVYPDTIASDLRAHIEAELAPHRPDPDPDGTPLWIFKANLNAIHSCEARWAGDERGPITLRMIQGTLSHMAIARLVMSQYRHIAEPARIVTDALRRLRDDEYHKDRWEFLNVTCTQDDLDELVATSVGHLIDFITDWPRLPATWSPNMEIRRRHENLLDGDVILSGQYDLAIGGPVGMHAQRRIIDMKSRGRQASHAAEAQYYALLETLRQGVPPYVVGTYYFETGVLDRAPVDTDRLYQAADRVVAAIRKMWEIDAGREPTTNPSGFCHYCSLRPTCPAGSQHVELSESA